MHIRLHVYLFNTCMLLLPIMHCSNLIDERRSWFTGTDMFSIYPIVSQCLYHLMFCRTRGKGVESDHVPVRNNSRQCRSRRDHQVVEMFYQGQREGQEDHADKVGQGDLLPALQDPLITQSLTLSSGVMVHCRKKGQGPMAFSAPYRVKGITRRLYRIVYLP